MDCIEFHTYVQNTSFVKKYMQFVANRLIADNRHRLQNFRF